MMNGTNKCWKHLVAIMVTIDGITYSTWVFNNTVDYKSGQLMVKQIEEKMEYLNAYNVIITGICADNGPDQMSTLVFFYY